MPKMNIYIDTDGIMLITEVCPESVEILKGKGLKIKKNMEVLENGATE